MAARLAAGFLICGGAACDESGGASDPASPCGNGVIDTGERCDGAALAGQSCTTLGFSRGHLTCQRNCRDVDTSDCATGFCSDGAVNGNEACDGTHFRAELLTQASCAYYGLGEGTIGCTPYCAFDFSTCSQPDVCALVGAYDNGWCDACDLRGGVADPECGDRCGPDGVCGEFFSKQSQVWVCDHATGSPDPDCPVCGDGVADLMLDDGAQYDEPCDGDDLIGQSCANFGFSGGTLGCNADCTLDFSGCRNSVCGDGVIEADEECEGPDLQGHDCASLGFAPGALRCTASCHFETSACGARVSLCGDGKVNGVELCDGDHFKVNGIQFCNAAYPRGEGAPACSNYCLGSGNVKCRSDCRLDVSECGTPDYCLAKGVYGDGQCDDCEPLGGMRDPDCETACGADGWCADWFSEMTLRWTCRSTVGTTDPDCPVCGNGVAEWWEYCDGADQRGFDCRLYGFDSGPLGCTNECRPDFTGCHDALCGDGAIELSEQCDATNLAGRTCQSLGFSGGTLRCGADCAYDVGACTGSPGPCGNGVVDLLEPCDGGLIDIYGPSCADWSMGSGAVHCTDQCALDFSACSGTNLCAVFGLYDNGDCDDCEDMKSPHDTECDTLCGADGYCADYLNVMTGKFTCQASVGSRDPDCGTCGNGVWESEEYCDADDWPTTAPLTCRSYGFDGGQIDCHSDCSSDLSRCYNLEAN